MRVCMSKVHARYILMSTLSLVLHSSINDTMRPIRVEYVYDSEDVAHGELVADHGTQVRLVILS